jgi:hypothetical protein
MKLSYLALPLVLTVCDVEPVLADPDPVPTVDDVLAVMASIPEEHCLFNPKGKGCGKPARYDRGPDARRIALAIVANANGGLTGSRKLDAAVYATYSSYESGNNASARGDCNEDKTVCKANGPWQIWYISPEVASDPDRAAPVWRSIATSSLKACASNPPDERMASVAGSCSYLPARVKVRQRLQAARDALGSM